MAKSTVHGEMPYRVVGSTKEQVSAIGLGGWHLGLKKLDEQLSIRIVREAIDRGINFMDNCWDYNDGASEIRMGKALRDGYRSKVFLMTKIDGRSKKEPRGNWKSPSAGCRPTASTWCSTTRSSATKIHTASSMAKAPMPRSARRAKRESSATSALPVTRTRASTSICSR